MTPEGRIDKAIDLLVMAAATDGAHHKQWGIDQALRVLMSPEEYQKEVQHYGEYWDEGIAP